MPAKTEQKSTSNPGESLLKRLTELRDKIEQDNYRLTVGDRRQYIDLSREFSSVAENSDTFLDTLKDLQKVLGQTQKYFK